MTFVKGLRRAETPEEQIERLTTTTESECLAWLGPHNHGYAIMTYGSKPRKMARVTRFLTRAPQGMDVDHLCHHPWCVNPAHLEVVTHQENIRRHGAWKKANRPVCEKHGTPFVTYGKLRICRQCRNEYQNTRRDHQFPHKGQRKFACQKCGNPYEIMARYANRGPRYDCRACRNEYRRMRRYSNGTEQKLRSANNEPA